jgi:uncharacterized membrane protein
MRRVHHAVIGTGIVSAALIGGAYALLGIGFAAMIAVGLLIVAAVVIPGIVVFEEETHLPLERRRFRR